MNLKYRFFLCSVLILFGAVGIHAQNLINLTVSGINFDQFVTEVETKTDYLFYYNPDWTENLSVSVSVQDQPLSAVLDRVLEGKELSYTIIAHRIYITRGRQILTSLPAAYFSESEEETGELSVSFDFSAYEQRDGKEEERKTYFIGDPNAQPQGKAVLRGQVRDNLNGEPIIGAGVFIENPMIGVITDPLGNYAINLPKGRHTLKIQSVGMKASERQVMLYSDGKLDIELEEEVIPLKEVIVEAERNANVMGTSMGAEKLDIQTMKQLPLALGETDVMKVMQTLPGVQSAGEGTSGINVRGGSTSQNLILYNDATIYNPAHLFGFFSAFNPDILKDVEIFKGGITADYGGRLSSVMEIKTRDGNMKKFTGTGGISPITGRLTLEGPIIKDKTSVLMGFRSTYSDWLLKQIPSKEIQRSAASFYDINAGVTHRLNDKNTFNLSAYTSQDKFRLDHDTLYQYNNRSASLNWKRLFGDKIYGTITGSYSQYDYSISSQKNPVNASSVNFSVRQLNAKVDFDYFFSEEHTFMAGLSTIRYSLSPGTLRPVGEESLIIPDALDEETGLESTIYIGDNYQASEKLSLYMGMRYSIYQFLGPQDVLTYGAGLPREESSVLDTLRYPAGKSISTYHGVEPRFSARYAFSQYESVKLGYNRMRQYIQMLSNTAVIAPTDTWKLSDPYIKPQIGDQISLGYYKTLRRRGLEVSVETYYKQMHNVIDYKDGAVFLLNHHIETDVVNARGRAYGVEFLLKKPTGKLNGWLSYTYSRSQLKTLSDIPVETINDGEYYPTYYDKPHSLNLIGNYKFNRRVNVSLNVVYSTGRPITLPLVRYTLGGAQRLYYSDRNEFRIPDYFRTDLSINFEGSHKVKKLVHSSWSLAVYNVLSRNNAYSVFFTSKEGKIKGYKLSIFAYAIPTINYNFKF